jgi:hypothetical protein
MSPLLTTSSNQRRALGKKLPERAVRIGATLSFVIFGLLLIAEGMQG